MTNKIRETYDWFEQFDNMEVCVKSKTSKLYFVLTKHLLLHLLGVQYAFKNPRNFIGRKLENNIFHGSINDSDEEILNKIKEYHPEKAISHVLRRDNFKLFLENLHNSHIVEMTNKQTRINSQYLVVQAQNERYYLLGIGVSSGGNYFETFMIEPTKKYFETTTINEPVISITELDDGIEKLFSFSDERQSVFNEISLNLNDEEFDKLITLTDFQNTDKEFLINDFKFYAVDKVDLNNISIDEIDKDGFYKAFACDDFKEKLQQKLPMDYKQYNLFYNNDSRSLYIPSKKGLIKFNGYSNEQLIELVRRSVNKENKIAKEQHEEKQEKKSFIEEMKELKNRVKESKQDVENRDTRRNDREL